MGANGSSNLGKWLAGGAAIALTFLFIKNLPVLRRYIKIQTM